MSHTRAQKKNFEETAAVEGELVCGSNKRREPEWHSFSCRLNSLALPETTVITNLIPWLLYEAIKKRCLVLTVEGKRKG